MYRQTGSQKTNNCPRYSKKKKGFDGECQIAWKFSFKKLCLFIYSFDCIVVANPFWFILRINIVHTVILTFLWQISYIPCLYIVYVTRLAIFVAKKSKLLYLLLQYIVCWNYWSIWCYVTFFIQIFQCLEVLFGVKPSLR